MYWKKKITGIDNLFIICRIYLKEPTVKEKYLG